MNVDRVTYIRGEQLEEESGEREDKTTIYFAKEHFLEIHQKVAAVASALAGAGKM